MNNSDVRIYVGDTLVDVSKFPGGDLKVGLNIDGDVNSISHHYVSSTGNSTLPITAFLENSDSIIALGMVKSVIDRQLEYHSGIKTELFVPKLPYMQQDRIMNRQEPLSIKVLADLYINPLKFDEVYLFGVHSDVASALIENCTLRQPHDIMVSILNQGIYDENTILISPDAGAEKQTYKIAQELNLPYIVCRKVRDISTGQILKTVVDMSDVEGLINDNTNFLIVDDVCVGGRTFIEIVKTIRQMYLDEGDFKFKLVTYHNIQPHSDHLKEYFDHIYAYPTLNEYNRDGLFDGNKIGMDIVKNLVSIPITKKK